MPGQPYSLHNTDYQTRTFADRPPPPESCGAGSIMPDSALAAEPSDLVKASPLLTGLWASGHLAPQEIERRAQGAQRLKAAFSSMPWHAQKAARYPDYWNEFYASCATW